MTQVRERQPRISASVRLATDEILISREAHMYLEHFGLTEAPFRITPEPSFFFTGAKRGATLDALLYAVTHDDGIVKVSGEVGCGKTMVCRMLLDRLPEHVLGIYLGNPSLSREDILHCIAEELQLNAGSMRASALLRHLQEHLVKLRDAGRQVVLLIDEAHALGLETLEEIRLLSNLEAGHRSLLQLVLFGQPELNRILARPDMRQLKERITHHFALEPLTADEVTVYLSFRLRVAGYRGPSIFSAGAVRLIATLSQGLTRRINVLADKSLHAACNEKTHQVARRHVRSAMRDSEYGRRRNAPAWMQHRLGWLALAVLLLAAPLAFWSKGKVPATAPLPAAVAVPDEAALQVPAVLAAEMPAAPLAAPPLPTAVPPLPTVVPTLPPAGPAASVAAAEGRAEAGARMPRQTARTSRFGSQTSERIAVTTEWLRAAGDDRWFIQLLATEARDAAKIEDFVASTVRQVGTEQVRVYVAAVQGSQRVGVIYGDYASREEALAAAAQLPETLRNLKPFPRKVKWLR